MKPGKSIYALVATMLLLIGIGIWGVIPVPRAIKQIKARNDLTIFMSWETHVRAGDSTSIDLEVRSSRIRLSEGQDYHVGFLARERDPASQHIQSGTNQLAEARLEMTQVRIIPTTTVLQPIPPGGAIRFSWNLDDLDSGEYKGRIWLYLRPGFSAKGTSLHTPLLVHDLEIQADKLFGLRGSQARTLGGLGLFGIVILVSALKRSTTAPANPTPVEKSQ